MQGQNGNIHAALTRSGDIKGSIIVGSEFDDALVVGGISYVVMDSPAFRAIHQSLHLPLSACARVCGDYLRLPGSPFSPVTLSALTSWFAAMFPAAASVTAVRLVTLQPGQRAYELSTAKGQLLYVTVRAPHYPLEIVDPSEGTTGFSQWNAVPPIKAPPPSQVLHR